MFSNRRWQQFALIFNLLGTVLLFYSFQATSSKLKIVTAPDTSVPGGVGEQTALCSYGSVLLSTSTDGHWTMGGSCPNWDKARAAAVVNIEYPFFEGLGFLTLLFGFLLQYLAVPQPRTIAEIRKDLKLLQAQERLAKRNSN